MRFFVFLSIFLLTLNAFGADDQKPKVAVFPMGGSASDVLRTHTDKALRTKLDRDGLFDPIDGYTMKDIADQAKQPINFDTTPDVLKGLASDESPAILIWGDLNKLAGGQGTLRLKILDTRVPGAKPIEYKKDVKEETDFRFAYEEALEKIAGVKKFEHPNEEDVHHDAETDAAFKKNPNLVIDGDFATEGHWQGIYMARLWQAKISPDLPAIDDVTIHPDPGGDEEPHNVLAMNISKQCAENNGMACLSDQIKIEPGIKYRVHFQYQSDGPTALVFVKGYTMANGIDGKPELREVYRRQLSEIPSTKGQWVTHECDLNPQHITFPVQFLKVDLYVYATPGRAAFSYIQLKEIGKQTAGDKMKDAAIKPPLDLGPGTRP